MASTSSATSTGKIRPPLCYVCSSSDVTSEEQQPLEDFFKAKGIRIKNEMTDDASGLLAAALDNNDLMESSEEEGGRADRGSADEDEESVDEDFRADSDSDVAEEYDSAHDSSGSDSDAEMADASDAEEDSRPKKKSKV